MSRTYREGGLSNYEKSLKKDAVNKRRASENEYYHNLQKDEEYSLKEDIKDNLYVSFGGARHRKYFWWRPINKWLNSNIGRNWNDVHSELVEKLKEIESSKLAINGCINNAVDLSNRYQDSFCFRNNYYVDDNNLLQLRKFQRRRYNPLSNWKTDKLAKWLDGRVVGKVGNNFYWFNPVTKGKKYKNSRLYGLKYKCSYERGYDHMYGTYSGLHYFYWGTNWTYNKETMQYERSNGWVLAREMILKQDKLLTQEELEFWNKIPTQYQEDVLKLAPVK